MPIHSIYHRCEDCDHSFRSTILDVPCPECGGDSYRVTLDSYDISVLTSMKGYAPEEIFRTLKCHIWFSYDKETLQACYMAIDALQDPSYDDLKQCFEDHYHQAYTSDDTDALEAKMLSAWEHQQEC